MRIAALLVPDFPLQALRRSYPELGETPLAVTAGPSPRDAVVAVAAEAAEMGVKPGMTAAQARQVAPAALLRATPPEVVAAANEALADVAGGLSPHVKRSRPGEVLLDAGGLLRRWGGEEALVHELLRRCHRVGLSARAGIAGSAGVAVVAARCGEAVIVPAGGERAFLAPLPLALLDPAPELAAALWRWGVTSVGALAALPRAEVALRLGAGGTALHRLACGDEAATFVPDPVRELLREGIVLDHALTTLEPFLFTLHGLLSRLSGRLEVRGAGFAELALDLGLEGGGSREYRIALTAPTREVAAVLALARLRLEAHPPGAAIEAITAHAAAGCVRMAQGSLFTPPLPAPGRLAATLARLAALVGPDRVGAPSIADTHRPAACGLAPFAPVEAGDRGPETGNRGEAKPNLRTRYGDRGPGTGDRKRVKLSRQSLPSHVQIPTVLGFAGGQPTVPDPRFPAPWRGSEGARSPVPGPRSPISNPGVLGREDARSPVPGPRSPISNPGVLGREDARSPVPGPRSPVLRAFRPPRPAQVTLASGRPLVVLADGCGGTVLGWAGPYRYVGEWWQDRPFARDDYDVATSDGAVLRLYYDRLDRKWYADGVYD